MKKETLQYLLDKFLRGEPLTADEAQLLQEWDDLFEKRPGPEALLTVDELKEMEDRMWAHIERKTIGTIITMQRRRLFGKVAGIAAAVIVILSIGIWWKLGQKPEEQPAVVETPKQLQPGDIMPGGNRAVLTLDDGTVINLDSAAAGLLATEGTATVSKTGDGEVVYNAGEGAEGEIRYNTIRTPIGGQYGIVLPDGSKVMLNAASSLRYPVAFAGRERRVSLTGEGYFVVNHDARQPFIVEVNGMEVHDLGTEFNINAYTDEPVMRTTLVIGRADVRIGNNIKKLVPGQAAVVKEGQMKIVTADVDGATAWRSGLFHFDGAGIETIMRQVARWYDVEVVYEGKVPKKEIKGEAFRNSTLAEMLRILKLSDIHFRVEGRKITITD